MSKIDWGWVSREMAAAKVDKTTNELATALLFELQKQREKLDLTDDQERDALNKVQQLAAGHSIAPVETPERWVPVIPGYYAIGDTVRVRNDAYDGERGIRHNGQRARVIAARDGFVLVMYEADGHTDIHYRHTPDKLELLR